MAMFVDHLHIHKRQGIMPLQLFGVNLCLSLKILQGHILRVHLGLKTPQRVLARFQTMCYDNEFFT